MKTGASPSVGPSIFTNSVTPALNRACWAGVCPGRGRRFWGPAGTPSPPGRARSRPGRGQRPAHSFAMSLSLPPLVPGRPRDEDAAPPAAPEVTVSADVGRRPTDLGRGPGQTTPGIDATYDQLRVSSQNRSMRISWGPAGKMGFPACSSALVTSVGQHTG